MCLKVATIYYLSNNYAKVEEVLIRVIYINKMICVTPAHNKSREKTGSQNKSRDKTPINIFKYLTHFHLKFRLIWFDLKHYKLSVIPVLLVINNHNKKKEISTCFALTETYSDTWYITQLRYICPQPSKLSISLCFVH